MRMLFPTRYLGSRTRAHVPPPAARIILGRRWIGVALFVSGLGAGCGQDDLDGLAFESEEKVGMGQGPDGMIYGHASLTFADGNYEWRYSDLHCSGSYTYDGGDVQATTKIPCASHGTIHGRYDAATLTLTWDEKRYVVKAADRE